MKVRFETDISKFQEVIEQKPKQVLKAVENSSEAIKYTVYKNTTPKVPIETGTLRDSFFSDVQVNDKGYKQDFRYAAVGKNGYRYAMIQHEEWDFRHPRGGQSHYLYYGVLDSGVDILKIIERSVSEVL